MIKQFMKARGVLFAIAGLVMAANVHAAPSKRTPPACTKVTVSATTTVAAGTTWDGLAKYGKWVCLIGSGTKMNGSQAEGQIPHFILSEGATLKNVILGDPNYGTGRNLTAGGA